MQYARRKNYAVRRLNKKREYYQANEHLLPREVTGKYEAAFRIEYTHNSTAIEGNTLSLIETKLLLEDKLSIGGKELREIYEVTNHAKAYDYARKCVAEGKLLDENTVKDIHQILMENIQPGGIYRNVNVRITRLHGRAVREANDQPSAGFQPPPPNEMYVQVKGFFADLPYKTDLPAIELAAWVQAEFVRIHPFTDGNGRVSRMIMNYQLITPVRPDKTRVVRDHIGERVD
ncbi:MAG: Fic family protein [Firmicutes bacterium]|nr:Fic family protein [Bacillota bacterium]